MNFNQLHTMYLLRGYCTWLRAAAFLLQVERVVTIMQNPRQYKIPDWFLNRQKDIRDGKYSQILANNLESKLRDDLERLKKIRAHRGLRHYWGLRVRGQHTKTTGRKGRTVGVAKKKN